MKIHLLCLIFPFFLLSCGGTNKAEKKASLLASQMIPAESGLAVSVWRQANAYRASVGEGAMAANRGLTALAQEQADYLASTGGLVINQEHAFRSRAVRVYRDYNMAYVTEFVYLGVPDSADVLSAWKLDKSYLSNLKSNWNQCGVGVKITPEGEAHVVMLSALETAGHPTVGPQYSF